MKAGNSPSLFNRLVLFFVGVEEYKYFWVVNQVIII
jgi:hypothetical protein